MDVKEAEYYLKRLQKLVDGYEGEDPTIVIPLFKAGEVKVEAIPINDDIGVADNVLYLPCKAKTVDKTIRNIKKFIRITKTDPVYESTIIHELQHLYDSVVLKKKAHYAPMDNYYNLLDAIKNPSEMRAIAMQMAWDLYEANVSYSEVKAMGLIKTVKLWAILSKKYYEDEIMVLLKDMKTTLPMVMSAVEKLR